VFGLRVAKGIEKTDIGFLDTNLTSFGSTRKPVVIGLRVAKRIEKTDIGFLDTNLTSFGSTRKPICVRSSSNEVYREDRYWFSRYEPHFVRFYSKTDLCSVFE